ncbi:type II secretion system protein GspG [Candidatus Sumerlaeota bacterium]|nr:type II secretion system protein GspG [Candidatus Sumerlaeota bacterium]
MNPGLRARHAFTLIELLIVVAIIAILAAIAVPNFLEAQTRSKVARTQADLRTMATAIEAYRVDNNSYPYVTGLLQPLPERLMGNRHSNITSPIAYMTSTPQDPFFRFSTVNSPFTSTSDYVYVSGNVYLATSSAFNTAIYRGSIYSLAGRGPDKNILFGGYCMAHPIAISNGGNIRGSYDPTNGTVSEGDILRLSSGTLGSD